MSDGTSRRTLLQAMSALTGGAAGVLDSQPAGNGSQNVAVPGGATNVSGPDLSGEVDVTFYEPSKADLPTPDSTPALAFTEDDGQFYYDTDSSSWEPHPVHNPDSILSDSRSPTAVVHTDGSTIWADGVNSMVDSGDFGTNSDVRRVIQSAINHAASEKGICQIKGTGSGNYTMGSGGTDAKDAKFCLEMKAGVELVIDKGATLEYPASNTEDDGTTPDAATPILCSGVNDWRIELHGTIEGGVHPSSQDDDNINTMGIKVGVRDQGGATACKNWRIEGSGTITGAYRHGIEAIDGCKRGAIVGLTLDDASGDDDISISDGCELVYGEQLHSINKSRSGGVWSPACYEIEDGASACWFDSCTAEDPDNVGFFIGKVHSGYSACEDVFCFDCFVDGTSSGNGYIINSGLSGASVTNKGLGLINCIAKNTASNGVFIDVLGSGSVLKDWVIDGGRYVSTGGRPLNIGNGSGTWENGRIKNAVLRTDNDHALFANPGGTVDTLSIRNNIIVSTSNNGINFLNTDSEYTGRIVVEDNDEVRGNSNWSDINFQNTSIRNIVVTRRNGTPDDQSSVVPNSPTAGDEYLDDGTNTIDGKPGYRFYNGSNWRLRGGARHPTLGADPGTSDLVDGEAFTYVSDGTADVTGDDGDVILAVNSGGTIKTTTLADFSGL